MSFMPRVTAGGVAGSSRGTASEVSSLPRGGADSALHMGTVVDGLPYSVNSALCKAVMLEKCVECFYID